jgi:peroxiredoxin
MSERQVSCRLRNKPTSVYLYRSLGAGIHAMKKIQIGSVINQHRFVTSESKPVSIPDPQRLTHLQFRRFAGCPFCSVHLGALQRRHDEIVAAGIREVIVFRSTASALQNHHASTPFAVIADPEGKLYAQFGVGSGLGSILNPRALLAALPNVMRMLPRLPGLPPWGRGVLGLPADFLLGTDGRVIACKYGAHADDQWSVDELLGHADKNAF